MITYTTDTACMQFERTILNERAETLSLYDAKSLKGKDESGLYNDIAITQDEYELLLTFYREAFDKLTVALSTVLNQQTLSSFYPMAQPDSDVVCEFNIDLSTRIQRNMLDILHNSIETYIVHYAMYRWYLTNNIAEAGRLSERYLMHMSDTMKDIVSLIHHRNDSAMRAKRTYRII